MATAKETVIAAHPGAKAVRLGRARWAIDDGTGAYLSRVSGNTAHDAWCRAQAALNAR